MLRKDMDGMSAAELEKLCAMVGCVGCEPAEPERRFSQRAVGDGMTRMTVTVPADEAAVVCAALDSFAPAPNRRAEGLVAMADECSRGDAANRNPTEVTLRIEADDLSGATGDGAGVPAETSRRLLCDAGVVPMLCDQTGKTLDVGRKTRTIPTAIRRALAHRDDGCRFPGCDNRIVDGHHIQHWIDGGKTKLANLVSLGRRHHRFVHEGGATVENLDTGEVRFMRADGTTIVRIPEPIPASPLATDCYDPIHAMPTDDLRPIDWSLVVGAITG